MLQMSARWTCLSQDDKGKCSLIGNKAVELGHERQLYAALAPCRMMRIKKTDKRNPEKERRKH